MDDLKAALKRFFHFKPDKRRYVAPRDYPVQAEPEYREDEIAFVVGLENSHESMASK